MDAHPEESAGRPQRGPRRPCSCSAPAPPETDQTSRRHQQFPSGSNWAGRLDLPERDLLTAPADRAERLYSYIIRTIKVEDGRFVQHGSAPNLQGGYVTLCTCKHHMRTFQSCNEWPGTWIAGFAGKRAPGERPYLVYLMQVGWAFESHRDLWLCNELPMTMKQAKAAQHDPLGDLFEPISADEDPFDPASYYPPGRGHSHGCNQEWYKDIAYVGCGSRRAALLVGHPERTFVWTRSAIRVQQQLGRGQKCWQVGEFFAALDQA